MYLCKMLRIKLSIILILVVLCLSNTNANPINFNALNSNQISTNGALNIGFAVENSGDGATDQVYWTRIRQYYPILPTIYPGDIQAT